MLNISNEELRAALDMIQKLDPRPASQESPLQKNAEIIIPDFTITNQDGKLVLSLNNQYVPKVRINKEFSNEYRFLSKEEYERRRGEAEKFIKKSLMTDNSSSARSRCVRCFSTTRCMPSCSISRNTSSRATTESSSR